MHLRVLTVSALVAVTACSGGDASRSAADSSPATIDSSSDSSAVVETVGDSVETVAEATSPSISDGPAPDSTVEAAPTTVGLGSIDGPARVRPSCASLTPGVSEFTLDAGGAEHGVRIFVPTDVRIDPSPIVLDFHGLGSNGAEQAAFTGYETLAEQEGFIVVHPDGVAVGDAIPRSWELTDLDDPGRDDLAFVDALIDTVVDDWCGDPDRIYSTGMSNGGFFTADLVCNRSTRIAAAVSVAGTAHPDSCSPSRAVPYMSFHGTADDVVPFDGSGESTLSDVIDTDGFFSQVMPDEFAQFATGAGCDSRPDRTEVTPEVVRYDYTGCPDGVVMTFVELPGSGHTWPDSPLAVSLASFGYFTTDIDATEAGWDFMSQFSL